MPPKKPPPPPSPSASESGSTDTSSSSEEEGEQQQQQQQQKLAAAPSAAASSNPMLGSGSNKKDSESEDDDEEDDSEDEAEGEEEGSDDSDSPSKTAAKPSEVKPKEAPATAAAVAKPPPPPSESESDSESSDSDAKPLPPRRPSRGPDPSIKPISSKPMDGTPKGKKPSTAEKPKPVKPSEADTEKRKRKEPEAAEEEEATANGPSGKKLFQRVWTEEDEIAVLKGMIEFQAKHGGTDPASSIDSFYEFIHKSLHLEFTKTQLADKMRRLKKKYETNLRRGKKGADPSFAKPHEKAAFELSKKIWAGKKSSASVVEDGAGDLEGDDMEVDNAEKKGEKKARRRTMSASVIGSPRRGRGGSAVLKDSSQVDAEDGGEAVEALYPTLVDAVALLEGDKMDIWLKGSLWKALELLKPATARALEEKWSKHFMAGIKYFLERSELKKDLLKSLLEVLENA